MVSGQYERLLRAAKSRPFLGASLFLKAQKPQRKRTEALEKLPQAFPPVATTSPGDLGREECGSAL